MTVEAGLIAEGSTVLVTGGAGFLARHVVQRLHGRGFAVRVTLRDLRQLGELVSTLELPDRAISALRCSLDDDDDWQEAAEGCAAIIHCASPFPAQQPRDPEVLVRPAVHGTLRVLRAAAANGVGRVILTSSMNAIAGGSANDPGKVFTEADWTDLAERLTPYDRSKTMAERAAWQFADDHPEIALSVINPGAIFGPVLGGRLSASGEIIRAMLAGGIPGVPRIGFGVVDVRDVADAHIAAMLDPAARGRRYICSLDEMWLVEVARLLAAHYKPLGYRVPTRELPDLLVRLGALISPTLRRAADHLGRRRRTDAQAVRTLLGRELIPAEDAILAMAKSISEHGSI